MLLNYWHEFYKGLIRDFKTLLDLRPAYHNKQVYICGGAARDYLLQQEPRDIDIFILNSDSNTVQMTDIRCLIELQKTMNYSVKFNWRDTYDAGYPPQSKFDLLGNLTYYKCNYPIQIITTKYETIDELFESFDWNICQVAINEYSCLTTHQNFPMEVTEYSGIERVTGRLIDNLKLHNISNVKNYYKTLQRGFIFAKRYNVKIEDESLKELFYLGLDKLEGDEGRFQKIDKVDI